MAARTAFRAAWSAYRWSLACHANVVARLDDGAPDWREPPGPFAVECGAARFGSDDLTWGSTPALRWYGVPTYGLDAVRLRFAPGGRLP